MKIAVIGSPCDPPHNDHLMLVATILRTKKFDVVQFVPCSGDRPDKQSNASVHDRVVMIELLFPSEWRLKRWACGCKFFIDFSDIYKNRFVPAIEVVQRLKQEYGEDAKITWCTGSDCNIDNWYNSSELKKLCDFLFIRRPGYPCESENCIDMEWNYGYSSSEIRDAIKRGESISRFTDEKVVDYIHENKLYSER